MVIYKSEKMNNPKVLDKINNILEPLRDIGLSEDKKIEFYSLIDKIIKNLDEEKSNEFRDFVYLSNEIQTALNIIFDDKSTRLLVKILIEINIFNKKLNLAYEDKIDSLNEKLTKYKDLLTKNKQIHEL